MRELFLYGGWGVLGGLARSAAVFVKATQLERKPALSGSLVYFVAVLSIGAFSGVVLGYSPLLGFLGGYAALDLVDSYHRGFSSKGVKLKG